MILHLHRQAFDTWIGARALRHRPAFHHAIELEAQIVVQVTGGVLLDDEVERFRLGLGFRAFWLLVARGFRGFAEVPLSAVLSELLVRTGLLLRRHPLAP